jgi:hypothetical protein
MPLFWSDAADNVGVTRYEVYRNDSLIQTTPLTNYTDEGFFPDSIYKYTVKARDGSGNVSEGVSIWIRAANKKPIVYNGTFEEGIGYRALGWAFDAFNITNAVNCWDTVGTGIDTSRSLHIHNTKTNDSRWSQEITGLTPGTTYILQGYIKGKDIDPAFAIGANLCISGTWNHTPGLTGTFDWTLVELSFVAPSSGRVTISCRLGYWSNVVSGKAWFDNISIIPVQPTIQALGIQVTGVTDSSAVIKFTAGNGNKRIVFISEEDAPLSEPSIGESFEPDICFGKGDRYNNNWYCIANGVLADHEVSVSGLTGGCTYQVMILEYNGEAGSENYLIKHSEDNPYMFNTPKRDQRIIINSASSKTYGDPDFDLQVQASSGLHVNLLSSDENIASIENGMIHIVTAGSCVISARQPGNEHYNPADSISLTLVIGKALLTVQSNDTSRIYGSPNPDFKAYYKGFVNHDIISDIDELPLIATTATTDSDVGVYPIVPVGGFDNNYSFNLIAGQLSVEKAKLWVIAADTSRKQGETNPIFDIQIEGFVNDEDLGAIDTLPVAICIANEQSEPGDYDITLSGGFAKNYEFIHVNGKLTVIGLTGVNPVISERLQFYPNPAHSFIRIIQEEEKPYHVKISDVSGRVVLKRDVYDPIVHIEKLTPGIYYVTLNNQTFKLIKY